MTWDVPRRPRPRLRAAEAGGVGSRWPADVLTGSRLAALPAWVRASQLALVLASHLALAPGSVAAQAGCPGAANDAASAGWAALQSGDVARADSLFRAGLARCEGHPGARDYLSRLPPGASGGAAVAPPADTLEALLADADSAWTAGETERAERLYGRILAGDPLQPTALHRMALMRAWREEYDASLALFDRLLGAYPEATDARVDRARVLAWQGRIDVAVVALEAVLETEPANVAAIEALAQFRTWAGRYEDALTAYARLEQLDPGSRSAPYDRARVLASASRYEDAMAVYDSILAVSPADAEALAGKGTIQLWAGRLDAAAATFHRLLDVEPGSLEALRGLARAAAWGGDLREAESRWRDVLERDPSDAAALTGLSQTLRWQGREAAALPVARRAVEAAPRDADARTELRWVEVAVGPQASPGYAYESDTDGNRISTVSATARLRPLPPLEVRVDGYTRAARQVGPAGLEHTALGGTLTGRYELGGGWSVSGGGGASTSDANGVTPSYSLGAATPRWWRMSGSVSFRRQAFDATAALVDREVVMAEAAASAAVALFDGASLDLGAGTARFESRASGQENRRWSAYGSVSYRPLRWLGLAATTRAFGFEEDLDDGYFDPDFFGLAELLARVERQVGPVVVGLEAAPGLQQVGEGADPKAVARGTARLVWRIGIGRELALSGVLANAGMQRLSAGSDAEYRYHALTGLVRWAF